MAYFEILPEGCPEADAKPVNNEKFFRLINAMPAVDGDFHSYKKLGKWPGLFKNTSECIACATFVLDPFIYN